MSLGTLLADDAASTGSQGIDPSRVIQAIVMGIGFICAGTIIRHRAGEHIEGLTTSAVILAAASIGICVAMRQLVLALGVTVITLIVLVAFRRVENFLDRRNSRRPD
jgi:putative Mg2+ transporter-C (MgtC) family protein